MRYVHYLLFGPALLLSPPVGQSPAWADRSPSDSVSGHGFAVVELFTSEGCSSCPPADNVLRDLTNPHAPAARDVYALEFHVDYWDELGWVDPFSAGWATSRQRAYASAFGERGVYTPQMIINGRDAFVGSDGGHARHGVDSAVALPAAVGIALRAHPRGAAIDVDFELSAAPAGGRVMQLALLEPSAVVDVKAGENAGRTMRHSSIVRAFRTIPLTDARSGHTTLARPTDDARVDRAATSASPIVVAFVQDPTTMRIDGASRATVAAP